MWILWCTNKTGNFFEDSKWKMPCTQGGILRNELSTILSNFFGRFLFNLVSGQLCIDYESIMLGAKLIR